MAIKRIEYAGSVHDEEEVQAVLSVLRGGATALRIGPHTREMERLVAAAFGKQRGIMVNSGSSALYLAVELLALAPGDEVLTPALTFSTDVASILRAGLVPVLVDVTPNTYQVDLERIEAAIGPRTKAMLVPNLIGNCPDWDALRAIADRHGLQLIEDSCDCLGATLRGTPTGTRSDISLTSFALSHIITAAGTGGMVLLDDPALVDRALTLRRWGRRSEPKFFGSQKGTRTFFSDLDGIQYDDLFIFDEVGWNFEPSELSAGCRASAARDRSDRLTEERRERRRCRACRDRRADREGEARGERPAKCGARVPHDEEEPSHGAPRLVRRIRDPPPNPHSVETVKVRREATSSFALARFGGERTCQRASSRSLRARNVRARRTLHADVKRRGSRHGIRRACRSWPRCVPTSRRSCWGSRSAAGAPSARSLRLPRAPRR